MELLKRFWKASRIGPKMVLLGAALIVFGFFGAIVTADLSAEPDERLGSKGSSFWYGFYVVALGLFWGGLFVMLFQGLLWLVHQAGVALRVALSRKQRG